ncbi:MULTISPECIES: NUDIX domain-containing protein [Pseudomonas]|uniref:NUDIX domain-containing protein n=1 Tax=Pseudomonas TaxID=286 RepID=UPI00023A132A|nr:MULTISPECIES: NUDIX domain-containing protein [Pseudomonas]EHK70406.1 GDP-mannose pyrophosphatase [Pseudomonas psychrotolerans L19]KTT50396.1 GDP-mannose pyrophosphatase [Pseudomonas psychrotolerans]MBA1180970.1 NUDIX domain-containing protein [Pseudomonas psychrotolerans]MBA1213735.1 NUDIX domain-containing protein [Pseudomonas psychrotolerans]MBH3329664.1 NUDIX domain-containing protein [Pseudomonas oryzihabitans]
MPDTSRIRIQQVETLSQDWGLLKKTTFDYLRRDGSWQRQTRETYDRGNGATILLYDRERRTVLLIRQFRLPTLGNGLDDGLLVETPAGLLDAAAPEARIKAEVEEETGYRLDNVQHLFDAFMSPGSVTELLHFFAGEYRADQRIADGGGLHEEGEDIELLELPFDEALAMARDGRLLDGKTIMLLQYAALYLLPR